MRRTLLTRSAVGVAAAVVLLSLVSVAALVGLAGPGGSTGAVRWGAAPAGAAEPLPPPSTTGGAEAEVGATTVPDDGAGIGDLDSGANSPSPRGEPAPPQAQRVADTAIFIGLLVIFVVGVGVAIWSARRTRTTP